jgi:hypothetical protein
VVAASRPTPARRAVEPSLELLGAYGQAVSTVIAVFGLFVTAGAALVGLYAFAVASGANEEAFDFGRELSRLLQAAAWTKIGGEVVHWRATCYWPKSRWRDWRCSF